VSKKKKSIHIQHSIPDGGSIPPESELVYSRVTNEKWHSQWGNPSVES